MKLYQYDDIKRLNQALGSFTKNGMKINGLYLTTVDGTTQYLVLAETINDIEKAPDTDTEVKTKEPSKKRTRVSNKESKVSD